MQVLLDEPECVLVVLVSISASYHKGKFQVPPHHCRRFGCWAMRNLLWRISPPAVPAFAVLTLGVRRPAGQS